VSVLDSGRLGNRIWEYAAVWSLALILDRPGYVNQTQLTDLGKLFANLSLRALEEIEHCDIQLSQPLKNEMVPSVDKLVEMVQGKNLQLAKYIFLPEPVLRLRKHLEKEFHFRPDLLHEVEETVERIGGQGRIRVGIHVRRTDYASVMPKVFKTSLVGEEFFKVMI